MSGRAEYLDIYVDTVPDGHRLVFIGLDNRPTLTAVHKPWFVVLLPLRVQRLPGVRAEPIPGGVSLSYDKVTLTYAPDDYSRPVKMVATHRAEVPKMASLIEAKYLGASAGLYNIRYEVRAAYDFADTAKFLGLNTPLIFRPNDEMVKGMEQALGKVSSLKVMAVDIEVLSEHGGFPSKGDPVLTITYSTFRMSDDVFSRSWAENNITVLSQPRTEDRQRLRWQSYDLVAELAKAIARERPNVVVTYNGMAFDLPYMAPFAGKSGLDFHGGTIIASDGRELLYIPHIDLMLVRDSMGSAMGVRSQAAFALDDVALEVAGQLGKFYDLSWLPGSDYVKAETLMNHAKLGEYWYKNDPLFDAYVRADVYLTVLIARAWLYPLYLLSALVGIPPSVIQSLNTGQIAEYLLTEYLRRLGFYPELRTRKYSFGRFEGQLNVEGASIFSKGKVYVSDYGLFGDDDHYILELDFAQLYPTDMSYNAVDPTATFITEVVQGTRAPAIRGVKGYRILERPTLVLLTPEAKGKKDAEEEEEEEGEEKAELRKSEGPNDLVLKVVHMYGPASWLIYKAYSARWETKRLKARAKAEGRPELTYPDQAVKIVNNSIYGSFSKRRGNLVSELTSAAVFWRTLKMLYEIVDFINGDLSKKLGVQLRVLYGDTDSTFVLTPRSVKPEVVVEEVNRFVKERYGELYEMELEDIYDVMLIPKRKEEEAPSGKSYIAFKNGRPAKVRGEFFKIEAPAAIKESLMDVYAEIVRNPPRTKEELRALLAKKLSGVEAYKLFIKKSVSSFVNEDDPRKLKNLNKGFHYAALYDLYRHRADGVVELDSSRGTMDYYIKASGEGPRSVTVRIDPRKVEEHQRAIIVYYLPVDPPKRFLVYVGDDGVNVAVDFVTVNGVKKVSTQGPGGDRESEYEAYYDVSFTVETKVMPKELLVDMLLRKFLNDTVVDVLYSKLIAAVNRRQGPAGQPA